MVVRFFSSVCSRLWSTYCTDSSVLTRSSPMTLQLEHHHGAGGILGERLVDGQGNPTARCHSPSTRWSAMSFCATFLCVLVFSIFAVFSVVTVITQKVVDFCGLL